MEPLGHVTLVVFAYLLIFTNTINARKLAKRSNYQDYAECGKQHPQSSFLWEIRRSSTSPPSFLFGSIHVPYTKVWDHISTKAKRAFAKSDRIVFELDLSDPTTVISLTHCQLLPHNKRLVDVIPRELYRRLKNHIDYIRYQIPSWLTDAQKSRFGYANHLFNAITGNWERKQPFWIILMINSLTENDIKTRGIPILDSYLVQEAQRLNKMIGSVEKVHDQCRPMNGLNASQVLYALNRTLLQHEMIRFGAIRSELTTDELIHHYNCGNLNEAVFNRDSAQLPFLKNHSKDDLMLKNIDDYFRSELIVKRNRRMSSRAMRMIKTNPDQSFFFVFGAGHFFGNHSILDFMQHKGFSIIHHNDTSQSMPNQYVSTTYHYLTAQHNGNNVNHEWKTGSTYKRIDNPFRTFVPFLRQNASNEGSAFKRLNRPLSSKSWPSSSLFLSPIPLVSNDPKLWMSEIVNTRYAAHNLSLRDLLINNGYGYLIDPNFSPASKSGSLSPSVVHPPTYSNRQHLFVSPPGLVSTNSKTNSQHNAYGQHQPLYSRASPNCFHLPAVVIVTLLTTSAILFSNNQIT